MDLKPLPASVSGLIESLIDLAVFGSGMSIIIVRLARAFFFSC